MNSREPASCGLVWSPMLISGQIAYPDWLMSQFWRLLPFEVGIISCKREALEVPCRDWVDCITDNESLRSSLSTAALDHLLTAESRLLLRPDRNLASHNRYYGSGIWMGVCSFSRTKL